MTTPTSVNPGDVSVVSLDSAAWVSFARPKSSTLTRPSSSHHIGGLQVAVDDALLVSRFERLGDLLRNGQRFFNGHWPPGVMRSRSVLPELAPSPDNSCWRPLPGRRWPRCWMIERREHPGFALESCQPFGSCANTSGKSFIATSRPSFVSCAWYTLPSRPPRFARRLVRPETCASAEGHYFLPEGTFCFNSSNQFSTTLICVAPPAPARWA